MKRALLLGFIVALFAVRNLPWHLDDLDQAKQAYTSYEMVTQGHWWFQHTPAGRIATKPPLAGWLSADFYGMMGGHAWVLAWRLPSFLSALALLLLLWKTGRELAGEPGALIAVAAFSLNLTTPRLATLVRTDMMLTLFIAVAGWLVFEKVRCAASWTTRERWALFAAVLASMLTKGPIAYAFLLPGLAAHAWIVRRRGQPNLAWSGWWPWLAPLAFFALWAGIGIRASGDFYEQVVLKEFLGRFTVGEKAVHNNQSVFYYVAQGLKNWLPWSVAFLALLRTRAARKTLCTQPATLWLVCWAFGGLLFMSLIPSKRFDRIFPVLPPLCLLLAALYGQTMREAPEIWRRLAGATMAAAMAISGGYAGGKALTGYRTQQGALVALGARVREIVKAHPERLAVVNARDEGMAMYTGATHFTPANEAVNLWRAGRIDWLLLGEGTFAKREAELRPFRRVLELPRIAEKSSAYVLLARPAPE